MIKYDSHAEWSEDLAAARRGDKDALGRLLQSHWASLWGMAAFNLNNTLRPKAAASDLVQETLVEAQIRIGEFRGQTPAQFESWLRKMLANNVCDVWRKYAKSQKRRVELERSLETLKRAVEIASHGQKQSLLNDLLTQEALQLVHQALRTLPSHYQAVIHLRVWQGMTFSAIASELESSPDAVRQTWNRALRLFALAFEKAGR